MNLKVGDIAELLASGEHRGVADDGALTQLDHALQTAAALCQDAPHDDELVVAETVLKAGGM